jgi:hypothetical protein
MKCLLKQRLKQAQNIAAIASDPNATPELKPKQQQRVRRGQ